MKHGLALIPDLASATRYAAICAGSAHAAKAAVSLKRGEGVGSQGYLATASELDEALISMKTSNNNTIMKKVYSPQPEPLVSVFRPRTLLVVLGRNFMSGLVPWMNELQDNINEAAEESAGEGSDDGEEEMMDVEVPPFRPVMAKAARGSVRDYAVLLLKRGMEIFASAFLEPHAACKLLKDHHASARRKRLRYFFDHRQPLRLRVQVGLYRVKRSSQTAARSALLGFLAELCVNEVLVIYRTVQLSRDEDGTYADTIEEDEGKRFSDSLEYFQRQTASNFARVSCRLVFASVGVGFGSLITVAEPKVLPQAVGKLGTVLGFAVGDFCGGKIADYLLSQ
ncbi:hypothetical protein HKI87_07g50650 [Chloropicon roscoffensis]|uniref:Uncharacterized protein n=1 Tax=Chloropicon roscoffensis TaxID=1461544 RepID=A0AAX4PBY3_9CHLO